MTTPIFDFVQKYIKDNTLRLHMPGHKGKGALGIEESDITEIKGADSLFEAEGIIAESEENASKLFGTGATFYSAEGSSLCIRAMLYLVTILAKEQNRKPLIFAGRNVHKTFISAAALLDLEVSWLYSEENSYLSCVISGEQLEKELEKAEEKPVAVYVTSPDYLGMCCDIKGLSSVCKKYGVLLIVDNAHGAYTRFLGESSHPMDLGADLCCDSAHKTLPVLTGGAYLHMSKNAPRVFAENARRALSLFGSTSPSYLILQSLDLANRYIEDGYVEKLESFVAKLNDTRECLQKFGYTLCGSEPLKLTIDTKNYGYYGTEFAEMLRKNNIECEFSDPDFVVFMLVPGQEKELEILTESLLSIAKKEEISERPPIITEKQRILSVREAAFLPSEEVNAYEAVGKILASVTVGCPPAVPILVCGEKIDKNAIDAFLYYGIDTCVVVKNIENIEMK